MNVAVIEDNDLVRQSYERILKVIKYVPVSYGDAESFLEADPDIELLIADLHLPGMSGVELLRRLRKDGNSVPFMLLSGDLGADPNLIGHPTAKAAFLGKPFSLQQFIDVTNQLTGKSLELPH